MTTGSKFFGRPQHEPEIERDRLDKALRGEKLPPTSISNEPTMLEKVEFLSDPVASRPMWQKLFGHLPDPSGLRFED